MIRSLVAPSDTCSDTNRPSWSGPRCPMDSKAEPRTLAGRRFSTWVNPAIPHMWSLGSSPADGLVLQLPSSVLHCNRYGFRGLSRRQNYKGGLFKLPHLQPVCKGMLSNPYSRLSQLLVDSAKLALRNTGGTLGNSAPKGMREAKTETHAGKYHLGGKDCRTKSPIGSASQAASLRSNR